MVSAQWTPETDGLIGEAELRQMKPSAYLINVARGEIIEQAALTQALQAGWIAGAGLDGLYWRIHGAATGRTLAVAECRHYSAHVRWNGCPAGQGPGLVLRESGALRQRPSPPECLGLGARLLKRAVVPIRREMGQFTSARRLDQRGDRLTSGRKFCIAWLVHPPSDSCTGIVQCVQASHGSPVRLGGSKSKTCAAVIHSLFNAPVCGCSLACCSLGVWLDVAL